MPHSGSRSLCEYLGIWAQEQGLGGNGPWWHFGYDRAYRIKWSTDHYAYVPIRNPMDVARSWASRAKTGDVLGALLGSYEEMLRYLEERPATLYRVEDIPRTRGMNEHAAGDHGDRIRRFQGELLEKVVEPNRIFFDRFL